MNRQIKKWKPTYVFYVEEIDKDLTYHLYCRYLDITREVYYKKLDGTERIRAEIWDRTYIAGYRPKRERWIKPDKRDLRWWGYGQTIRPGVRIDRTFVSKNQLIKLVPQLKYVYPEYQDKQYLYEFVTTLKEHPQLELIYKNEYLKPYWKCKTLYKMSKQDLCKLAKFIEIDDRNELTTGNLLEIIYLMKHPNVRTKEQWENIKWLNLAKKIKNFAGLPKDLARYLKKTYEHSDRWNKTQLVREYQDYTNMCERFGIFEAYYPRNLQERIENLSRRAKKEDGKKPMLTDKVYKKYSSKLVASKNLTLQIPKTPNDLVTVGNKLHNCVGSNDYDERVKNHESLIIVAYNDKKMQECCEIDLKEMRINQLYGDHNSSDGKYHVEARNLINRYIREIRA